MSSGALFVESLKKIQYPSSRKLQSEGFDWLFDNEGALPFLDWFCNNISSSNLLTSAEIKQYNLLQSSPESEILSGEQLEAALNVASLTQEEELSNDELEAEIEILEDQLRATEKRKPVLIHFRNKLSLQHTALTHKSSKLGTSESTVKRQYKQLKEQLQTNSALLNSSLDDLSSSSSDLIGLYLSSGQTEELASVPFLSQANLQQYHAAEDKFTQGLKVFTKRQFFEGIADLAGYSQSEEFKLLDISDPESLLLKGEGPQVREGECHELERLKTLYADSQKVSMKALVEAKRAESASRYAEECIQMTQDIYPGDTKSLSERLQDVQSESQKVSKEVEHLWRVIIPDLMQVNMELQATHVLYGDYNLKILRQNYFTSKQDTLIRQLVVQRARNYFLGMGYEAESQVHQQNHRELSTIEQMLEEHHRDHQTRIKLMSDSSLVVPKSPRKTVNSRDVFMIHLSQIIKSDPSGETQQLFLTFKDILNSATHLSSDLHKIRDVLRDSSEHQDKKISTLEKHMKSCETAVYDRTVLPEVQVLLTPHQIQTGITQLEKMIENMEQTILEIMGEYSSKWKVLKSDPLEVRCRQLFVHFFNQPAQLRREIKAVMDQLQALSVT